MLEPERSFLMGLDAPLRSKPDMAIAPINVLLEAAAALAIPIIRARYPDGIEPGIIETHCPAVARQPTLYFDPLASSWAGTALATTISASARGKLLVCGFWLEEGVTLLALQASRIGLDVYVPVDATAAIVPEQQPTLQSRLTQHNVVLTTTEQVLREWAALTPDAHRRAAILPLLKA